MLKIVKCRKHSHGLPRCLRRSIFLLTCIASTSFGDPWANAGDERARFHIQVLSDAGKITHPLSTWPIMWVDVAASLADIDIKQLSDRELWSYRYLKHAIDLAKRPLSGLKRGRLRGARSAVNDFASTSRERAELSSSITGNMGRFSLKLRAGLVENAGEEEREIVFDGSYLAATWGNWVLGAGAIDRWWGPGWQSSLIMSNNARPSEGLFLQRKQAEAFSWPLLSLLGPWSLHLFANQLEARRPVANTKLFGGRATFKPLAFFEFGLSRVAQWGGEGRSENLQTLRDVIFARDSRDSDPGNQTASIDWRLHWPFFETVDLALYHQQFTEDGKALPDDNANIWGVETGFLLAGVNNHFSFEYYDSRDSSANGVYEHEVYQGGYRIHGRSIGAGMDTASLGHSLLAEHYFSNGHQLHWRYARIDFNTDSQVGGHPYGNTQIKETLLEIRYTLPLSKSLQVQTGLQHLSEPLDYYGETIESHLSIGFDFQW